MCISLWKIITLICQKNDSLNLYPAYFKFLLLLFNMKGVFFIRLLSLYLFVSSSVPSTSQSPPLAVISPALK